MRFKSSAARFNPYAQVATVSGGRLVFVAGQVALDAAGNVVGKDDVRAQVQNFLDLSCLPVFREVRDQYINLQNPPVSTAVQVPRLFRPEFLVEVEAVAVTGNEPRQ